MRKFSWFILVVNVLFLIWVIAGAASKTGTACTEDVALCQSAQEVGKGIGVVLIIVFWAVVDVILGVLWLVTKPKEKPTVVYVEKPADPSAQL